MKILVTGGAGFIGSHVVDGYINAGHEVVVLDDLSSGKRDNVNIQADFAYGSITDRKFLESVFKNYGPIDLVSHQAAQKSVSKSIGDPVFDADVNVMGTLNLLETMRGHGVLRIIFASTAGVYKEGGPMPLIEVAEIEPISPYTIAKYAVENYLRFYRQLGVVTQILRYANVYGPRQDPEGEAGVVAIFCARLLRNQPLVINGDGLQTRDFIYVNDVVAANMHLTDYQESGTWNIGTGQETSILDVAHLLGGAVEHAPAQPGELRRSVLNCQHAQEELDWVASTDLQTGLRQTTDSFREGNHE